MVEVRLSGGVTRYESAYAVRACVASLALILQLVAATAAVAQPPHPASATISDPTAVWSWSADANVFFGLNYQHRQFLDASSWESQNWMMVEAGRPLARGDLRFGAMLSLEPFTLRAQGSPQLFQTGETYRGLPLVHYQHPHDLLMGLGISYRRQWHSRAEWLLGFDLVGAPTLGPQVFMHRGSARNNPQAPLAHHLMDSTHVTSGVARAGVKLSLVTVEGSLFRGAEPNENRLDLERPAFDSWAARAGYQRGPWQGQASVGRLRQPDRLAPYDVTRITASVSFDGQVGSLPLRATGGWGANREFNGFNGNHEGSLFEWDLSVRPRSAIFGRAERVQKDLFPDTIPHPRGQGHPHYFSTITAITAGFVQDVRDVPRGRVGVGADATLYHMPRDTRQFWGGSRSFHVFLRWRPVSATHTH